MPRKAMTYEKIPSTLIIYINVDNVTLNLTNGKQILE